nr:saccharopine dehydrogenase NADP-binding domain-containing protein [Haliscomenobacter sp.]
MHTRQYDLILWGASGFTGRLVAEYLTSASLSDHTSASLSNPLNWAVAGRNREKLQEMLNELGHPQIPIIIADGFNKNSLLAMAAQAKVVCTTVGPYTQYGSLLVEACVSSRTHYCDLSGEAGWMRQMIDRYHQAAKDAKIKIVHSCGFDSIPSDMGVYFLQKEIHKQYGVYATHIKTS